MLDRYVAQVRLLVDMLPEVAAESDFALKGGIRVGHGAVRIRGIGCARL